MPATDQLPEGTDQIIEGASAGSDADTPDFEDAPAGKSNASKSAGATGGTAGGAEQPFFARFEDMKTQGIDRAREYAVQGKDKATGALDEVLRMVNEAADQIDAKVGNQYGDYARRAVESLGGFNETLKGKDVDVLFGEARELVRKAPAVAIGTAAALGFVIARLARAGVPEDGGASAKPGETKKT